MQFDSENKVIKLCIDGMTLEGEGKMPEAAMAFQTAWDEAVTDFEKFTAAHYVARHQSSVANKLKWDETALEYALKIDDETIQASFPSLYLNVAKCFEELNDQENARKHYQLALSYAEKLPLDGYGNMIRSGIKNGIERMK